MMTDNDIVTSVYTGYGNEYGQQKLYVKNIFIFWHDIFTL